MDIHSSKSSNILWFVESLIDNKKTYLIKGWVSSYSIKIDDLVLNDIQLNISFDERKDVLKYYSSCYKQNGGFEIEVSKQDIHKVLYVKSDNSFYELGTLMKWVVYYSGYDNYHKDLIVVDNFYKKPDMIREYTINNLSFESSNYNKGQRSTERFILDGTKEKIEYILSREIKNWNHHEYANGIFQYCTADQPIVYHIDSQSMAAVVFLTPDAPLETGTSFFKSKFTGKFRFNSPIIDEPDYLRTFTGDYNNEPNFYDSTLFDKVDEVANVYNRLVIWDAKKIHSATKYFGDNIENSRYFQLFFFDV